MAKKEPLVLGQRVWTESWNMFLDDPNERRKLREYEVVEVNNSSAYIVSIERLNKYQEDTKMNSYMRTRVEQKTHEVKNILSGYRERLWLSIEAYNTNIGLIEKKKALRKQAHDLVDALPMVLLEEFIATYTTRDNK